jgi:hypothetical protein
MVHAGAVTCAQAMRMQAADLDCQLAELRASRDRYCHNSHVPSLKATDYFRRATRLASLGATGISAGECRRGTS